MVKVEITRSGLSQIGRNGYREVGRASIRVAAVYWWKTYLPLHFQNIAYRRYRYAYRDDRYSDLKEARAESPWPENKSRAIGEDKPHVFSGRTRERALGRQNITAVATTYTAYRADVSIDAPVYNFSSGKRINLRDEVTRFTPQEKRTMENIFAEQWEQQLIKRGVHAPRKRSRPAA